MPFSPKPLCFSLALALLVGLGCATTPPSHRLNWTGDPIRDGWNAITNGPVADRVLWQYKTALEHFRRHETEEAKQLLDAAISVIQGRYGKDASARKARGYFSSEDSKRFIGEPYERSMAYYYRGLLFWQDGELDNARACFRSAQFEDSDPEGNEYAGDFALFDYLDGLTTFRLKGDGLDAYQRATNSARLVVPDRFETVGNVLLFAEYGNAPEKVAMGEYREKLKLRDGGSQAVEVVLRARNKATHIGPMDDLSFQATTRGGREMDHILANQAVFKRTSDAVGDVALMSGIILAQDRKTQEAGLGLAAFGLVSKLFSAATTPKADTRAWDNLPKFLAFGSMDLPPGQYVLSVEFLTDARQPIDSLRQEIPFTVNSGGKDTVVFISEHTRRN